MITCLGLSPALDITYGVDAVVRGAIHRPTWKTELPGGKSLNVVRALRTLGAPARAIAPLGGATGERLRAALHADGVPLEAIRTTAETRTCISVADADGVMTEFYEVAPPLERSEWAAVVAALSTVSEGWLAVSGSVPDALAGALADAVAAASDRGIRIALDLRGPALEAALEVSRPDLVKVNRAEAEELVGGGDARKLAARLRERGVEIAVVTDGAAGSVGIDAGGAWGVSPVAASHFTVGAGDSFLAGLLDALGRSLSLPDALGRASAVAAANTLRPGAAVFDPADAAVPARVVSVSG